MSVEPSIREEADRLLEILVNVNALKDIEDLFRDHARSLITLIGNDCASWSVYSTESQVFGACLSRGGAVIAHNDLVLPIFKKTMDKDADPELKLRHFILLSEYFSKNWNLYKYVNDPHEFVNTIIEEIVIPGLIWAAGRAAEAIRTAAICCLCAILQNEINNHDEKNEIDETASSTSTQETVKCLTSIKVEQFLSIFDRIVPILVSLVDDKAKKTRLYSMRALCSIILIGRQLSCLTDEHIHRTYPVILKRLDDGCDDVRYVALEALVEIWSAASEDYDVVVNRSHIDALYTTMIIHLDDPESHFQQIILDALKRVANILPDLLHQKLHSCQSNFRNKEGINILLEHCQNILRKD